MDFLIYSLSNRMLFLNCMSERIFVPLPALTGLEALPDCMTFCLRKYMWMSKKTGSCACAYYHYNFTTNPDLHVHVNLLKTIRKQILISVSKITKHG